MNILHNYLETSIHILLFDKIVEQAKLTFICSIEFNYAPRAFANTWVKNSEHNVGHELPNNNENFLPQPRIEMLKKIPIY
jgi:hypothetical protein